MDALIDVAKHQDSMFSRAVTYQWKDIDNLFYAWQCVTLVRPNRTTLDLVIKDPNTLMYLLHGL